MNGLGFLILLALAGSSLMAAIVMVRWGNHLQWQHDLVAYELSFPRGLDAKAVAAFVAGLSGLVAERFQRPFVARAVMLEVTATSRGRHHLLSTPQHAPVVLSALRAAMPSVGVRPDPGYRPHFSVLAAELALSGHGRTLAVTQAGAISTAVLASLQPLRDGEQVTVQWSARPLGPVDVVPKSGSGTGPRTGSAWDRFLRSASGEALDPDALKAARDKQQHPLFAACGRVGVTAQSPARTKTVMGRVLASLHVANAPGVHLYRRWLPSGVVMVRLGERRLPLLGAPCVLNAAELGALVAFPVGEVTLPGLRLGGCKQLAPASDIPTTGRVVAEASFPGAERPLALSVTDALRHLHVIGPTGSGKSTLLLGLIAQDMAAGRGVVVLDPKGDLVESVLGQVPHGRLDDVVVLDPSDEERPVGLNLLAADEADRELVTEHVVGTLHNLYKSSWGPRTDDILRSAVLTLVGVPGMTLAEVPLLLTDAGFRRRLVGRIDDPIALGPFWGWYEGLSDAERMQAIGPVMNKLRAFLLRRRLRNVIGQAEPHLNLDQALATNKIVLVPLAKGLLGEEAAALIGSLVVARVWQSVQRRAALAPEVRPLTFAFVDEFQDYMKLPMSVADVLAQARSLGLGLTLAHQHLGQLPTALQEAVLANARSRVIFQTSAKDARTLARELAPYLGADDLQGLGAFEVVATLSAGARIAPPVTGRTLPASGGTGQAEAARQRSRERFGRDRKEVEAAIRTRHEGRPVAGGIGQRVRP
jgi:uncharacterized protein DUF87